MTLSTTVQFEVAPRTAADVFELDHDAADAKSELGAVYDDPTLSLQERRQPDGRYGKEVNLVRLGRAPLRLFAPEHVHPEVRALNPPAAGTVEPLSFWVGWWRLSAPPSGYDGQAVEYRGWRTEVVQDVLQFRGETSQSLRYGAYASGLRVLETSIFLSAASGAVVSAPKHMGGGAFSASEAVIGALAIEYTLTFRSYWVYYDIPGLRIPYEVMGGRVFWPLLESGLSGMFLPPALVVAKAGASLAMTQVPRKLLDWRVMAATKDKRPEDDDNTYRMDEVDLNDPQRVENPSNPSQYVDVQTYKRARFTNSRGETIILEGMF